MNTISDILNQYQIAKDHIQSLPSDILLNEMKPVKLELVESVLLTQAQIVEKVHSLLAHSGWITFPDQTLILPSSQNINSLPLEGEGFLETAEKISLHWKLNYLGNQTWQWCSYQLTQDVSAEEATHLASKVSFISNHDAIERLFYLRIWAFPKNSENKKPFVETAVLTQMINKESKHD